MPKATGDGERPTAGAVPVPDNASLFGLVEALLVTVALAARAPVAPGVKVTLNVQLLPAARLLAPNEHGVLPVAERAKSPELPPVTAMLVIFSAALPLLVRVMVRGPLGEPAG